MRGRTEEAEGLGQDHKDGDRSARSLGRMCRPVAPATLQGRQ